MAPQSDLVDLAEAPRIASYSIQAPDHPEVEVAQVEHRIHLANHWRIPTGARVLELGCGQGNTTAVLADGVGPKGHVDAVDPGALDYGAPFTLAQAQEHLNNSAVGDRISWHQATPEEFLQRINTSDKWDVAVLAHCIWYFASPSVLGSILKALEGRVARICVAEYALHATHPAAVPHVLAVVATGVLESFKKESSANVRNPLSPRAIKEIFANAGWQVDGQEATVVPEPGLLDGSWETGSVKSKRFLKEVQEKIQDERTLLIIETAREAVLNAVDGLKGEKPRTMDVWAASYVPGRTQ